MTNKVSNKKLDLFCLLTQNFTSVLPVTSFDFMYRNEQHKFNQRIWTLLILSKLRVFVRFENSYLPRIWKVSNLAFIFNILFSFTLNKMMVKRVKRS